MPRLSLPAWTQYISFFESDGHAIVYGDIDVRPADRLVALQISPENSPSATDRKRSHGIQSSDVKNYQNERKWPDATISYKYDSEITRDDRHLIVEAAIKNWLEILPFLKFQETESPGPPSKNILTIQRGYGCSCHAGFSPGSDN